MEENGRKAIYRNRDQNIRKKARFGKGTLKNTEIISLKNIKQPMTKIFLND